MVKIAQIIFVFVCLPQIIGGIIYYTEGTVSQKTIGIANIGYGVFNVFLIYIVPLIVKVK